jgi:hypothetical protein
MAENGHLFVFLITLVVFALVLLLVFKRKINERFAVLWVGISLTLLLASSFGYKHLFQIAQYIGIPYPPSALFLIAIFGLTLLIIELFAWASKLNDRTRVLTQEIALLRDRVEQESKLHDAVGGAPAKS